MSEDATAEAPALRLSARRLQRLAVSGGFRVDENTGDRMIKALEETLDSLNSRWDALQKLGASPPLSATATAGWVSGHMVATATDDNGLLTRLHQARAEIPAYIEAIRLAKRNYQQNEEAADARFRAVDVPAD